MKKRGTVMRVRIKISKSNPYYISPHRYLELRHFCLQYDEWKKRLAEIVELPSESYLYLERDVTGNVASLRAELKKRIELVEWCAKNADAFIGGYILEAVTKDLSYNTLWTKYRIPASKDLYFNRYHKFFWLLDSRR